MSPIPIVIGTAVNFMKNMTWKGWLMAAAILVVLTLMGTCAVNKITDHLGDNQEVKANNEDRQLREDLSEKRQTTEAKITAEEKQLNEVLDKLPDNIPSDRRIARACNELRARPNIELPPSCRS